MAIDGACAQPGVYDANIISPAANIVAGPSDVVVVNNVIIDLAGVSQP